MYDSPVDRLIQTFLASWLNPFLSHGFTKVVTRVMGDPYEDSGDFLNGGFGQCDRLLHLYWHSNLGEVKVRGRRSSRHTAAIRES